MKTKLLIAFLLAGFISNAQIKFSELALYNGNMTGAYSVGYVGNANRRFDMNTFLLKGDTATMLTNYKHWLAGYATPVQLATRLLISDTGTMLANYRHWTVGYLTNTLGDARYRPISYVPTFSSITGKPTTIAGYGITDAFTQTLADARYLQSETDPKRIVSVVITGTNTKTVTITLADATIISNTFTDLQGSGGSGVSGDADSLGGQLPAYYLNTDNHTNGTTNKVYTATEKTKLAGIAAGATNVTNNNQIANGAAYITASSLVPYYLKSDTTTLSNRIDLKVDKVTGKGLSTEDYTTTEKTKLSGIATGATANRSDAASDALLALKANTSSLATVAATGVYSDLTGKPTIPAQLNPTAGANMSITGTYPNLTFTASGVGGGGDILSALSNSEVDVTGATTLTSAAFGKMHVCSGTSANYTITLPAVAGNAGKIIGFRMASGLTKLVSIDGNGSETIDDELLRVLWAKEVAVLLCDGTTWTKVAGKSVPMYAKMLKENSQSVAAISIVKATFSSIIDNNGGFADLANSQFLIPRKGRWAIYAQCFYSGVTTAGDYQVRIHKTDQSGVFNIGQVYSASGGYPGPSASTMATLNTGDSIMMWLYHSSASSQSIFVGEPIDYMTIQEVVTW